MFEEILKKLTNTKTILAIIAIIVSTGTIIASGVNWTLIEIVLIGIVEIVTLVGVLSSKRDYKTAMAIIAIIVSVGTALFGNLDWQSIQVVMVSLAEILTLLGVLNKTGMETTKWNE